MVAVSEWNHSRAKRALDLLLALALVVVAIPLVVVIAPLIRLTSPGPILFRQLRSGKDGKAFYLVKFRTMYTTSQDKGPKVTRAGDPRVTGIGRILRKWKLDELPQLWNVVRGDMSFVGPRPDVPEYLATLPKPDEAILSLRPGLTGLATLQYRHEEEILATVLGEDLHHLYCTRILPEKVRLDLDYAQRAGLVSDLGILLRTLRAILN